ncbi:hypothetical protein [Vibrio algivorus]|nr:hypothetical protein [Vibrio algivorus]
MKRKYNNYYHVYILCSRSDEYMVKVGKSNNLKRAPKLNDYGYAGITDWEQKVTLHVDSNEGALALESMINVKLTKQGYLLPKIMWDDLLKPGRRVGATECYNCHIDYAVKVGVEMAEVYEKYVK